MLHNKGNISDSIVQLNSSLKADIRCIDILDAGIGIEIRFVLVYRPPVHDDDMLVGTRSDLFFCQT